MAASHRDEFHLRNIRERIARESARLLHRGAETDCRKAIRRAARQFTTRMNLAELPTAHEVREHLRRIEASETAGLELDEASMRLEALRMMRLLRALFPRLRPLDPQRPELLIRVHTDDFEVATDALKKAGLRFSMQQPRQGFGRSTFTPIALQDGVPCRIHVHPASEAEKPWFEPSDGERIAGITLEALERELNADSVPADLDRRLAGIQMDQDRFELFRFLLMRLEGVKQDRARHPEGDALHHVLQVFDLAVGERPYDEEFLTAALLHDVGKAQDSVDPIAASLQMLDGAVTHRTRRIIECLPLAAARVANALKPSDRQKLEAMEDFEEIRLLEELDRMGRIPGKETSSVDEALEQLRRLDAEEF